MYTVVDPGFSELEGMLSDQMGGLAISDQKWHENEKILHQNGGHVSCMPF